MLSQLSRLLSFKRLLKDDRGALAAIVGLAIIPLFARSASRSTARAATCSSPSSPTRSMLRASPAAARSTTDLREEDIMMFFEANFPTGYMSSELAAGHPIITFNDEENTVTIVASATIPTRFMSVAGVHEMTVSARTRDQARAAGHGAGAGDGQHRLDAQQRRHGGDEAGRDRAGRHPVWRPRDRDELLGRRGSYAATVNIGAQHETG